jgi:hypothetical protein
MFLKIIWNRLLNPFFTTEIVLPSLISMSTFPSIDTHALHATFLPFRKGVFVPPHRIMPRCSLRMVAVYVSSALGEILQRLQ